MRNYEKPEVEIVKFTTEAITGDIGMEGGTISGEVTDE